MKDQGRAVKAARSKKAGKAPLPKRVRLQKPYVPRHAREPRTKPENKG